MTAACTAHLESTEAVQLPLHILPPLLQRFGCEIIRLEIDAQLLQARCRCHGEWYGGPKPLAGKRQVQPADDIWLCSLQ